MEEEQKDYRLSTWRAEFVDPGVEQAFRAHIRPQLLRDLHIVLWAWAGLLVLFAAMDYGFFGVNPANHLMVASRGLTILALLLLGMVTRRRPIMATDGYATAAATMFAFLMFFFVFFLRPGASTFNIGVMMVMLIAVFVCIPNRLVMASAAAVFAITGTLVVMWLLGVLGWGQVGLLTLLAFPTMLGYFACQRLQLTTRRQYIALCRSEAANRQLAKEIERRKLLEQELKHQAITDPLTGLLNRRHFESLFNRELERARRTGAGPCLCMIDLDHFKRVNDEHGHETGDRVLQFVADFLRAQVRQTDLVARLGGEEFIILMPETTLEDAAGIVERIRVELAGQSIGIGHRRITVTGTFALTAVSPDSDTLAAALRKVDHALYQGKGQGRDCLVLSSAQESGITHS